MKKISLIALSLALVLSCTACDKGTVSGTVSGAVAGIESQASQVVETAQEKYKSMTEEAEPYTTLDSTSKIALSLTAEDETIALTLDMNLKADFEEEERPIVYTDTAISIAEMGLSMNTVLFYVDGYQYVETMGQKMKVAIPLEGVISLVESATPKLISTTDISDFEAIEDGDKTTYSFSVAGEEMNELYTELTSLAQEILGLGEQSETDFETVTCNMVVSGTSILSQEFTMSLSTIIADEPCEMAITASTIFNSINEPVEIIIPTDLSGYTEVTA